MKKYLLLLGLCLAGCSENSIFIKEKPCELNNEGTVKVVNSSNNPYLIYVDSDYIKTVLGNSSTVVTVKAGPSQQMNVEQKSGYLFYPTKVAMKMDITACVESIWFIP